jgi:hypothetical protein
MARGVGAGGRRRFLGDEVEAAGNIGCGGRLGPWPVRAADEVLPVWSRRSASSCVRRGSQRSTTCAEGEQQYVEGRRG